MHVPRSLWRRVRLHCVERDPSMQDFTAEALREKLAREGTRSRSD
jgi:hypothetical protein